MLNVGMTELLCFAIVALLVLGPEKLPEAARFAAKWYGKAKRFMNSVQTEVDRELKLSEFRQEIQKEIERMTEIEQRLQKQLEHLSKSAPITKTENTTAYEYQWLTPSPLTPFSINHLKQHATPMPNAANVPIQPELKIAV